MAAQKKNNMDVLVAIGVIETKVDALTKAVDDIKDTVKLDIEFIKTDKVGREEMVRINTSQHDINADVESRLRFMERYVWSAVAGLAVVTFILNYFRLFEK